MTTTINEVRHLARQKYGETASVREQIFRVVGEFDPVRWYILAVDGQVLGARRRLEELPDLVERGKIDLGPRNPKRGRDALAESQLQPIGRRSYREV